MTSVEVNGRTYARPSTKTAVVCLDGVDPRYVDDALERNIVPRLRELVEQGVYALGRSQLPSFTNPNNLSIVTGAPPAVHGLPGNHYLSPDGEEVQLTDPSFLRAPSILAALEPAGTSVLAVTTKDKLRRLLGTNGVPCVSAERAADLELAGHGNVASFVDRMPPGIYDWDCSHYALELGLALGEELEVELMYVSLTDFVQHAAAPGDELSDAYLTQLDVLVGAYLDDGWRLGLVADHGMNAKPRVQYLGDALESAGVADAHVILPITDPYVVHHAALGSACWIHVEDRERAAEVVSALDGVEEVLTREDAAAALALPAERIGDLFVLADAETALGRKEAEHDLSALRGPLRSHGGRHEQAVPILLSEPIEAASGASNADVFFLLTGDG